MAADFKSPLMLVMELEMFRPAETGTGIPGWATRPWGTMEPFLGNLESTETLRASDCGYRTRPGDAGGVVPYPPIMNSSIEIDRNISLDPSSPAPGLTVGALRIYNPRRSMDGTVASRNIDGRPFSVYAARKVWDASRGIYLDPPKSTLTKLTSGVARQWGPGGDEITIPLADATYYLERDYQSNTYLGTGGLNGSTDLKGKKIPRTRGGTVANPILNVTPVLVDALNLIYQWNDGPGELVNMYEGADTGITFQEDVADLYAGATNSGQYRTNKARGLFQLGRKPVREITVDVTGAFPVAGVRSTPVSIAFRMMVEDMQIPDSLLDIQSFVDLDSQNVVVAGWYFGPEDESNAIAAVSYFLNSVGVKLVPRRSGVLSAWKLRRPSNTDAISAIIDESVILDIETDSLPSSLDPRPYRFRVGYQRNNTIQTTDLDPDVTDTRKAFLKEEYRYPAGWVNVDVLRAFRNPNDPPAIPTALLVEAEANAASQTLGALWGDRVQLYAVTVPLLYAMQLDIGNFVSLRYGYDVLDGGRRGTIVGEQMRTDADTCVLRVLS